MPGEKEAGSRKRKLRPIVAGMVILLAFPSFAVAALRAGEQPIEGLKVEGFQIPPDGDLEAVVHAYAESWLDTPVTIDGATVVVNATRRQLGASVDEPSAIAELQSVGRGWNPIDALQERRRASAGELNVEFDVSIDGETLRVWLSELQPRIERAPVPSVARAGQSTLPGIPGVSLGLIDGTARLRRALFLRELYIQLPVLSTEPSERSPVSLGQASFTEIVGAFETFYAPRMGGGRSRNIERATRLLNGAVVAPGGTLSFNERVGERTESRGFHGATELRSGRRVAGVGGGVCQVSATLYGAAFLGGLDVLEHHPHSRNLGYVQPGLDAAVVWGRKDLVVRNPYPFFIRVQAYTEERALRVQLFGARPAPPVDWRSDVLEEFQPGEERVVNEDLAPGERRITDEGEMGLLIELSRTVRAESGTRRDVRRVRYPAASRIIEVAP